MNINKLLSQSTWKGKEVGKAVLLTLIELNKTQAETKPLFSKEDIRKMVKGLANEHERDIYNRYVDLNNAIIDMSMLTEGYLQQAYHGYFKHLLTLMDLHHAQDSQRIAEAYPVIMTEKQYQDHYARAQKETRELKASFKDIILELLGQYTADRTDKPKTPKPIKDALEALKKEPVTSEFILSRINEHYGLGYRQLPDGRRSDQMSTEEWRQAVEEILTARHNITIDGRPATFEETMREVGEQRLILNWKRAYESESPVNMEDLDLEEREELSGITWHTYETPPEGLTKWDIIAGDWDMTELYAGTYREHAGHEDECFREFIKDFPRLFTALKEELAKYKGLDKIAETKPANYLKEVITWGELADAGIWHYQDMTTPSHWDVVEKAGQPGYRKLNGIAILKEDTYSKSVTHIDENGYFIDPYKNHLLDKIMETDPAKLNGTTEALLMEGLRLVLAYNTIMDIFAEVYSTPELKHLKKDEGHFKGILGAFNNLTMSLYASVKGSDEEQREQRTRLKEIYPTIDLEALRPTEEATSKVKARIADKGVTGVFSSGSQENSIHNYILELAGINKGGN